MSEKQNPKNIIVPNGYRVRELEGLRLPPEEFILLDTPFGECFRITDRDFGYFDTGEVGIDWWTNGAISKAIEDALNSRENVTVLDVGGGPLSKAAFDIVSRYERVWAINVDPCTSPVVMEHPRLQSIQGDIIDIELDRGIDIAYSFQVLNRMTEERRTKTMRKIQDLVNDGAVAIIDYTDDKPPLFPQIEEIDYFVTTVRGRNNRPGEVVMGGGFHSYIAFRKGYSVDPIRPKSYDTGNI